MERSNTQASLPAKPNSDSETKIKLSKGTAFTLIDFSGKRINFEGDAIAQTDVLSLGGILESPGTFQEKKALIDGVLRQIRHSQPSGLERTLFNILHASKENLSGEDKLELLKANIKLLAQAERNQSEDPQQIFNVLEKHLRSFYQKEAKYLPVLSEELNEGENPWPIAKTYRELATIVTEQKTWALYVIKQLDERQLIQGEPPSLERRSIVLTAEGYAYLFEEGDWIRRAETNCVLRITGIELGKLD